jgi:hypothetical protein
MVNVLDYMRLPKNQVSPIMTKADLVMNVSQNGYVKPATGLNMLRETIMGHELFDFSFREYARDGLSNTPHPLIFSGPWKMQCHRPRLVSGGVGSLLRMQWIFRLIQLNG